MAFETIFEDVNFNYQVNRVLSFGDIGCNPEEVLRAMQHVNDTEDWYNEWRLIAEIAEKEERYIHSMYYYRMAEFMLTDDRPEKDIMYGKMRKMFEKSTPSAKRYEVPYKNGYLPCLEIGSAASEKTILVHGGYDSFIEEFYFLFKRFVSAGYRILLFEGEGQGETLRQGMKFTNRWENSVGAILDYFKVEKATIIGISWGGFLALRAAAFEKRLTHVISFGGFYDGLDVQFSFMNKAVKKIFTLLYKMKLSKLINFLIKKKMSKDSLANWAISHGMYITGKDSPYEFYRSIENHSLGNIHNKINQKVLLLAGEEDHYIPHWQHDYLEKALKNASISSRMFTKNENGEQHCQVGNYKIALDYILVWLQKEY